MHGIDNGSLYKKKSIDPNSSWIRVEGITLLDIEFRTGYLFGIGSDKKVYRKLKRVITSKMVNYESCCLLSFEAFDRFFQYLDIVKSSHLLYFHKPFGIIQRFL